ncbi:janus kinase and microtubule-interacting protein 1 isoform X2 [Dermochelys coriacea]|uniref:janus kinase and microtubule-interacting protein 1 isoform X2 n=1 Tax=Dermochelys coriacea TaxID=27794 RepID=UPI001CA92F61|nr:janus kinase and microtubule-interacting protein 1 isoform X2 [Dermochelys coriacea]
MLNLRIKQLEKSEQKLKDILEDYTKSNSALGNRAKELELSQKKLFETVDQLNAKLQQVENANLRVKGKLRNLQVELTDLVQKQEKAERKQKEKLWRLQDQLKTKEDEVKSQSVYFEHYKQKQKQKTAVLRERELSLQGQVSRLEKEVLDLNATTAFLFSELGEGTVQYLRCKLEAVFNGIQGSLHLDVNITKIKPLIEDVDHYMKSHIQILQQNLKRLQEKEEGNNREQADLLTKLQHSQDNEDFLERKLEESCCRVYELKLSEINLQERVEELMEENITLKDKLGAKLPKEAEKELLPAGMENGENKAVSGNWNGDLFFQDEQINLKRDAVLDPARNKASQTPSFLQHTKRSHTTAKIASECGYGWLNNVEGLPKELLIPFLEHSSSALVETGEEHRIADTEQVILGTQRSDGASLFGCTPSQLKNRQLILSCSERLSNDGRSKGTKEKEYFFLLKEQAINQPANPSPVFKVATLIEPQFVLLEPEIHRVLAVRSESVFPVNKMLNLNYSQTYHNNFCLSNGILHVVKGVSSGKDSEALKEKVANTETEIFKLQVEKHYMEKCLQNKKAIQKSTDEKKNPNKEIGDEKNQNGPEKSQREEKRDEKAQIRTITCISEKATKVLIKIAHDETGEQKAEPKFHAASIPGDQNMSVLHKELEVYPQENSEFKDEHGKHLAICTFDEMNRRCLEKNIFVTEEKGKQPKNLTDQIKVCRQKSVGLKEKREQCLKLSEREIEDKSSCKQMNDQIKEYNKCSQKLSALKEDKYMYPLNILSPAQERNLYLNEGLAQEEEYFEHVHYLSAAEENNGYTLKIDKLEKLMDIYSQRISALMKENGSYSQKLLMLQEENDRYYQKMCALEEEIDAYSQHILTVHETDNDSSQKLLAKEEIYGKCYNSISKEKNFRCPGAICVLLGETEILSKNVSHLVKEEDRNSEKEIPVMESNTFLKKIVALDEKKIKYFQLLSGLKEERNSFFREIAKLLQDKEKYIKKTHELEEERERNLQIISQLEGDKETLLGSLSELKCEQDKHMTMISELNECKTKCYQTISDLQEEKHILKNDMDGVHRESSEQLLESQKVIENILQENNELKEIMSALGISYEDLIKDKISGIEGKLLRLKQENKSLPHRIQAKETEVASGKIHTKGKVIQVIEPSSYLTRKDKDTCSEEEIGSIKGYCQVGCSKNTETSKCHFSNAGISAFLGDQNIAISRVLQKTSQRLELAKLTFETEDKISSNSFSECCVKVLENMELQQESAKGSTSESNSAMQEQLERSKEELKVQQGELEKAKKEAQNWYRELGFVEAKYEEVRTQLTQALSELHQLKQADGGKRLRKQCCQLMTEELQKRKTEADLTVAPLKAKLSCLVRKCHERNSLITQLVREFHRHGIMDSIFNEEAKNLVNDMALAEYTTTFTSVCNRERRSPQFAMPEKTAHTQASQTLMPTGEDSDLHLSGSLHSRTCTATADFHLSPELAQTVLPVLLHPAGDTSQVNGLPNNHGTYQAEVNEKARPIPASFLPKSDDICCAHITQNKCTTSPLKLTCPERIIALHRELRQNHHSNYQIPSFASSNSKLKADCNLSSVCHPSQDVTSQSVVSKMNNSLKLSDRSSFHLINGRDQLSKFDDVFHSHTGNQHAGAVLQGRRKKNVIMNNTWILGEKPDGSTSATTAKSYLSDVLSASNKGQNPTGEKSAALERVKASEIKQGPPAPVGSVYIIKAVGKSNMMIGWERPVVDELGCSNGTFITGYRIYTDGEFRKSVTSSACTKTILENLDLSVPFQISVQTVGSSGLVSEKTNVQFSCPLTKKEASPFAFSDYPEDQKPGASSHEVNGRQGLAPLSFLKKLILDDQRN